MNIICSTESTSKDTIHSVNHVPQNDMSWRVQPHEIVWWISSAAPNHYTMTQYMKSPATWMMNCSCFYQLFSLFFFLKSVGTWNDELLIYLFIFFYKKRKELLMFRLINFLCSFYGTYYYYYYYYFNLWFCEGDSG